MKIACMSLTTHISHDSFGKVLRENRHGLCHVLMRIEDVYDVL